jgi:hypothetical protein
MNEDSVELEAVGDVAYAAVEDRVAGDPQHAVTARRCAPRVSAADQRRHAVNA